MVRQEHSGKKTRGRESDHKGILKGAKIRNKGWGGFRWVAKESRKGWEEL
jgi:hypothetical protein